MHHHNRDGYRRALSADIVTKVAKSGWSTLWTNSPIDDDGNGLPFVYSQGLALIDGHPDFVITGLPPRRAHAFVYFLYDMVRRGKPIVPDTVYDDTIAENYPCQFKVVNQAWIDYQLNMTDVVYARINYTKPASFLHLIMTDRVKRWPWDAEAHPGFVRLLPRLDVPPRVIAGHYSACPWREQTLIA